MTAVAEIEVGKAYRHFKGGDYAVVGFCTHSETLETMVLYRARENPDGRIWVRPIEMFKATVLDGTWVVPRFTLIE